MTRFGGGLGGSNIGGAFGLNAGLDTDLHLNTAANFGAGTGAGVGGYPGMHKYPMGVAGAGHCAPVAGVGGAGRGMYTSLGIILVLYILLVIILRSGRHC